MESLKTRKSILEDPILEAERERCKTDHAFLAECLGYTKFVKQHDEVWKFFIQKNPKIQPFEKFAVADTDTHDRALFLPRNGLKSTANIVDIVQFMICWPEIEILLVTGVDEVGRTFVGEIKAHFERTSDGFPRVINGKPSKFQQLFPKFCVDGEGAKDTFTLPSRSAGVREPTIQFAGIETSMSGPHFDLIIFDDAITNENTRTPQRLINIRNQISYFRKMMNPYGYCTYIGTWYSRFDHYAFLIRAEEQNGTLKWEKRSAISHDVEGKKCMTKILLRPAMWEKQDKVIELNNPMLEESDWVLWFPERLTWQWLMKERATNIELFYSQLMNNPNVASQVRFSRELMTKFTRVFTQMPEVHSGNGLLVQAWDTAYKDTSLANYTVGFTALLLGGRFYFLDMVRGQFNDFECPKMIAESMAKWRPHRVVLEDVNGARWLAREAQRELQRMNFYVGIEFMEVENTKNRKSVLAAPVVRLFGEGRIILSNAIPFLDHVYNELEGFQNGAPNDDVVDAMSVLVNYFMFAPEVSNMALSQDVKAEQEHRLRRMQFDHVFGLKTGTTGFENLSEQRTNEEIPSYISWSPMDVLQ
jgi:predicted phage terminase large subunit-like protein